MTQGLKRWTPLLVGSTLVVLALLVAACAGAQGPEGPPGPAGSQGPEGPAGPAGPAGEAALGAEYVGSATCAQCHEELYAKFMLSGHPWKLNKVENAQPPDYPYSEVPEPPAGYTWDEIAYVIGGYGWKARFISTDGFIITGDADATTQYNFPNAEVGKEAGWVAYHAGEEKPYNCGPCHTTGYSDWPADAHQDDLPGIVGTWAEPGIQCERCHGPGGNHVEDPGGVAMKIDRDSQLCGDCHVRGSVSDIDAKGGFTKHHEQAEEMYASKHMAISCVSCHDPHASALYADEEVNPNKGIWNDCQACHFEQATNQKSAAMAAMVECTDCHMPPMAKSAWGNADIFTGDVDTHLFAINVDPDAAQFSEDGSVTMPYITVPYACGSCHVEGAGRAGAGIPRTVEDLVEYAVDYHERP